MTRRFNLNEFVNSDLPERREDLSRCETSGKEMHPTERAAEAAAAWSEKRSGTSIGTYYCLWCGAWHLTSSRR